MGNLQFPNTGNGNGKTSKPVNDSFTPTLGQTVFALSAVPASQAGFDLYLNGKRAKRSVDFTQVGTVLTWLDPSGLSLITTDDLIARYENIIGASNVKYIPVAIETSSTLDNQRVRNLLADGAFEFTFVVPPDFASLVSLQIFGTPTAGAAGSGKNIDLYSNYYGLDEPKNQHIESDIGTTYDFTGNTDQGIVIDLSNVFSDLSADDSCGVKIDHETIGGGIRYTQIVMGYTT